MYRLCLLRHTRSSLRGSDCAGAEAAGRLLGAASHSLSLESRVSDEARRGVLLPGGGVCAGLGEGKCGGSSVYQTPSYADAGVGPAGCARRCGPVFPVVVMRVILIFTGVSCVLQKQLCANHVLFLYLKVRKSSRRILDIFSFPTHPLEQCGCFSHGSKAGSQAALLAPPGPWLRPRLRWGSSGQGPPPSGGAPPSCLWSGPRPHGQLPLRGQGHQSTPRGSEWSLACVPGASAHPLGCILGPAGLDLPAAPGAPIWRTGTRICPGVYLWLSKLSRQLSRSVRPWVWGLVFFEGGSQVFNRGLGGGQAVRCGWLGAGLYGRLAYSRAFTGPHWPQ